VAFAEVKVALKRMPATLGGHARKVYADQGGSDGDTAEVDYGDDLVVSVSWQYYTNDTPNGKKQLFRPADLLSAQFGLVYACKEGTYRGSAPQSQAGGGGPGVTGKAATKRVWFACQIAGAEGQEHYSGYAVGWTTKAAAWLCVAPDKQMVGSLVSALQESIA
jgi:hypothetical protein